MRRAHRLLASGETVLESRPFDLGDNEFSAQYDASLSQPWLYDFSDFLGQDTNDSSEIERYGRACPQSSPMVVRINSATSRLGWSGLRPENPLLNGALIESRRPSSSTDISGGVGPWDNKYPTRWISLSGSGQGQAFARKSFPLRQIARGWITVGNGNGLTLDGQNFIGSTDLPKLVAELLPLQVFSIRDPSSGDPVVQFGTPCVVTMSYTLTAGTLVESPSAGARLQMSTNLGTTWSNIACSEVSISAFGRNGTATTTVIIDQPNTLVRANFTGSGLAAYGGDYYVWL